MAGPAMMRSGIFDAPGKVAVRVVERPEPGPGQVLLRVLACGLCASEMDTFLGHSPDARYPTRMGHEVTGEVVARGPGVEGIEVGQTVAAVLANAGYAEYAVAAVADCLPITPEQASYALLEPLSCAFNTVRATAPTPADGVVVIGAGFLGLNVIQILRAAYGPAYILAVARRPVSRAAALRAGADDACPLEEMLDVNGRLSGERGADVVIECAGTQEGLAQAAHPCRLEGTLCIAGFHQGEGRTLPIAEWNWKALRLINAHFRSIDVMRDGARRALSLLNRGLIDPRPLITHHYPLDALPRAFGDAVARPADFIKAVVEPWARPDGG